jgi:tetratricopeptide (TPR) repeat protein
MTPQSLTRAEQFLRQAIARDPQYAAAYYALGLTKWNLPTVSSSQESSATRRDSLPLFRRALNLDPGLAEAHAGLANYAMEYEWDWAGAESELRAGLAGDPSAAVENAYAYLLVFRNRFAEADAHIRRSQELDPVGSASLANRALLWNLEGRFAKSRDEWQRALQRFPDLIPPRYMIAFAYIEEGRPELALPILRDLERRTPAVRMFQAMAAARMGHAEEARRLIRPFEEQYPQPGAPKQWFALVYAFLGDEPDTVKWLERSAAAREWQALNLAIHPVYAPMRGAPAFQALVKRMGLE